MKKFFAFSLVLTIAAPFVKAEPVWTAALFDMPESAIYDAARDRIILSVIGGHPEHVDGNGKLALLSSDGAIIDGSWTGGLNAPKGMAIVNDALLVADLTQLVEISLETGEILQKHDAPGAVFLNDVTARDGEAFVSDLMTDTLWRYADQAFSVWLHDPRLSHPNGVYLDGDRLLVGSWGADMKDDFSTGVPGSLLEVSLTTKQVSVLTSELGNLDGIARIGDQLLVSDWITGNLFSVDEAGASDLVATYGPGLADISAYGATLYIPMMLDGKLIAEHF